MKKLFTLLVSASLTMGAFAQDVPSNAVGYYRTRVSEAVFSSLKTATFGGITVTQITGSTTETTDLDNDENYGTSTSKPYYRGVTISTEDGKGRIYPITKLSSKDDNSYVGLKMTIPEGKKYNIDRLLGQGFFGSPFSWCVDIVKDGSVIYTTGRLTANDYKKKTTYVDSINVTKDKIGGLCADAVTQINGWKKDETVDPEEYVLSGKIVGSGFEAWGNVLTDAVKNLSGDVELRFYYWNKYNKVLMLHSLYVELSEAETTGIVSARQTETDSNLDNMYNLAGQKVGKGFKGIVVVNGRKFLNK